MKIELKIAELTEEEIVRFLEMKDKANKILSELNVKYVIQNSKNQRKILFFYEDNLIYTYTINGINPYDERIYKYLLSKAESFTSTFYNMNEPFIEHCKKNPQEMDKLTKILLPIYLQIRK
ncbi:unknown [Parabacteroides sp. CAG:409]|nr:unknown [Parabacteroides sp. CAG:409]